jgi:hypothetical protein
MWRRTGALHRPPASESLAWTWAVFNGSGTPALTNSRNCSSLTDNAAGDWTVNFISNYAAATYAAICAGVNTAASAAGTASGSLYGTTPIAVSSVRVTTFDTSNNGEDSTQVSVLVVGAM